MEKASVKCKGCSSRLRFTPRPSRTSIKCPKCGEIIDVAHTSIAAESAGAPALPKPAPPSRAPVRPESNETTDSLQSHQLSSAAVFDEVQVVKGRGPGVFPILLICIACVAGTAYGLLWYVNQEIQSVSDASERPVDTSLFDKPESTAIKAPKPRRAAPVLVQGANSNPAQYELKQGEAHTFRIEVKSGEGSSRQTTRAACVYSVARDVRNGLKNLESSGTGFVISADGYIATCSHVIDRAARIEVQIEGDTYEATLVAQDPANDLAIIRIAAENLTVCPLGDSDSVELAETARAFGYPLSTVLGTDLKVVTGSVAGIVSQPDGGQRIQTDAPINPGNSGGPLVNDFGQVIGIASSKLSSRMASSVGLAVPANELKALMKLADIKPVNKNSTERLSGPTIAKKITPGMAFIRIRGASGKVFELSFDSRVILPTSPNLRGLSQLARFSGRDQYRGSMKIDQFGMIVEQKGDSGALPFALGPVSQFCLAPLDHLGRTEWSTERALALQFHSAPRSHSIADLIRSGMNFSVSPRRRQQPQSIQLVPAEEVVRYTRKDQKDGQFVVRREYQLVTLDNEERPALKIEGSGETRFRSDTELPAWGRYSCRVTSTNKQQEVVVPVDVVFRRYTRDDIKNEEKAAAAAAEKKREAEYAEKTIPNPELIDQLVAELANANNSSAMRILSRLSKAAVVDEKRESIRAAIAPFEQSTSSSVRTAAFRVLVRYCSKDDIDGLKNITEIKDSKQNDLIRVASAHLVRFGQLEYAKPLIKQLGDSKVRTAAARELKQTGPAIEEILLENFPAASDRDAYREAIGVLSEVGTSKSLPLLNEAAVTKDLLLKNAVKRAIRMIEERTQQL